VPHSGIRWGFGSHDFLTNLCATSVGNLIGGTLFVALPFQLVAWLLQRPR
jgi:formate transporter